MKLFPNPTILHGIRAKNTPSRTPSNICAQAIAAYAPPLPPCVDVVLVPDPVFVSRLPLSYINHHPSRSSAISHLPHCLPHQTISLDTLPPHQPRLSLSPSAVTLPLFHIYSSSSSSPILPQTTSSLPLVNPTSSLSSTKTPALLLPPSNSPSSCPRVYRPRLSLSLL